MGAALRQVFRVVFWLAAVFAVLFAITVLRGPSDLKAVCGEAHALQKARLLDASRQLYLRVQAADGDRACAKLGISAVALEEGIHDRALVRARMYRRAARLKHGPPLRGARRTAYFRAMRGYITALKRDAQSVGARDGLRALVKVHLAPTTTIGYERRCALGTRLTKAGLLTEANTIFASALRSGQRPAAGSGKGCRPGLRAARDARAKALAAWREGHLEERLGNKDAARDRYIAALGHDPSLGGALKGRARVGSRSVYNDTAVALAAAARDGSRWTQGAAKWIGDRPVAAIAAALLLGIVGLLLIKAFYGVLSFRALRGVRRTLTWWPLRRYTQTTAEVSVIEGDPGVSSTIVHILVVPVAHGYGPDVQQPSEDVLGAALDEVLGAVPQLAGLASVAKALRRLLPSRRFIVRGEVIPSGPNGVGVLVHISDWRGRRKTSRIFWSADWAPPSAQDDDRKFYAAAAAGWWVRGRLDR